jgi:protein XagA
LAQRFRLGDVPNEFRADFTFGLRPVPRWLLLAQCFNVISEGAGSQVFPSYNNHLSLQLGGFTTYTGRNALQENGVVAGMWYRF